LWSGADPGFQVRVGQINNYLILRDLLDHCA
jgi:hypothetical protein